MADDTNVLLYERGARAWPRVAWSVEAFERHLAGEKPRFIEDFFLAGAAGHRVEQAWVEIEESMGPACRRVMAHQPMADYTPDDVWAETRVRLLADDDEADALDDGRMPARIHRYRGMVKLVNYLVVIAKRLAISRRRRMRPTLSIDRGGEDEEDRGPALPDAGGEQPSEALERQEQAAAMREGLMKGFRALTGEQQFLVAMVYRHGMKQKEAGALLDWSEFKTSRQLSKAMATLRKAMCEVSGVAWSRELSDAWARCLQSCWREVQDLHSPTSEAV